jgi:replicative DNA helicase
VQDPTGEAIGGCIDMGITKEMFSDVRCSIYEQAANFFRDGKPIDSTAICIEGKISPIEMNTIENLRDGSAMWEYFADKMLENHTMSRLQLASTYINESLDKPVDEVLSQVTQLIEDRPVSAGDNYTANKILNGFVERIQAEHKRGASITTNIIGLNQMMPIYNGQMITLAARPGYGKTALACQMAFYAAVAQGKSVAFFSMEMSRDELMLRGLSIMSGTSSINIRSGEPRVQERVASAVNRIQQSKLHLFDDANLTTDSLMARCKKIKQKHGLDFVVVDYLQLMTPHNKKDNREQQVGQIARDLKKMAMHLQVPVLTLSQLNRDVTKSDRKPKLCDLRESGSIEQDSDIVMFIHPKDRDSDLCEIIIEKHRNGALGSIEVEFLRSKSTFSDKLKGL